MCLVIYTGKMASAQQKEKIHQQENKHERMLSQRDTLNILVSMSMLSLHSHEPYGRTGGNETSRGSRQLSLFHSLGRALEE